MSVPENAAYELDVQESSALNSKASSMPPPAALEQGFSGRSSGDMLKDSNTVDWDGPDDAKNPLNWPSRLRMGQVVLVSIFTLYANLAATMFAPGAGQLIEEFHVANGTIAAFTVTIYVLGFAVGPLLIAPLSELYGRLVIYHLCNVAYFAFTLGCAFSTDVAMFLVFRFLCGCAASAPMTIGGGTVADVTTQEKRGKAMAVFAMGPLLGPVLGPIIGGFLAESKGWRWTFWLIAILSGTFFFVNLAFLRETNATVLLERKAARLRKETGNPDLVSVKHVGQTSTQMLLRAILRPMKMLIFSPIVLLLSLYCAIVFGIIFLLFTTFPTVFEDNYGFSTGISGLAYLGLGFGMIVGLVLFAGLSDKLLNQKPGQPVAKPELRLPLMMWFTPIIPVGCFWYGWSAEEHAHWIVPILGSFVIGLGSLFIVMPSQLYLVDVFGAEGAASALAANTVLRNIFGTFLPLAAPAMYANLGLGWGNSVLGFLMFVFIPIPFFFWRYGELLRTRFVVDL